MGEGTALVLLSHVSTLQEIIFVTQDYNDAVSAMMHLLQLPSRWAAHIDQVLQSLDSLALGPRVIHHELHLLPTRCEIIPASDIGFVYVLVSTSDPKFAYVGETCSIRRRLREHNTGHGSRFTQDPALRPWALLALVSGLPGEASSQANPDSFSISGRRRQGVADFHKAVQHRPIVVALGCFGQEWAE